MPRRHVPLALLALVFLVASPVSARAAPGATSAPGAAPEAPGVAVAGDARAVVAGDEAARARWEANPVRAYARLDSPAGWHFAEVRMACVPDLPGRCDTEVDCEPGTLNCWATSRPRPPFPCRWVPPGNGSEGRMVCDFNQTEPEPRPGPGPLPEPPRVRCEDALSPQACRLAPREGDDAHGACRRVLAREACAAVPAPAAACREVFSAKVCRAAGL